MSDMPFEEPRVRHRTDGVDAAVFLDYSKSPARAQLPFASGMLLEVCMIYKACDNYIQEATGMSAEEFIGGMRQLLSYDG